MESELTPFTELRAAVSEQAAGEDVREDHVLLAIHERGFAGAQVMKDAGVNPRELKRRLKAGESRRVIIDRMAGVTPQGADTAQIVSTILNGLALRAST